MDDPRRTVEELFLRLRLEPHVFDVVVEGSEDQSLINWFLEAVAEQLPDVRVYTVDDLWVPSNVFPVWVDPGARDRVIRISELIASEFASRAPIVLVADRDLQALLPGVVETEYLLLTDGVDLEALFFDEGLLDRLQALFLQRRLGDSSAILTALGPILTELFLMRAADHVLGLNLGLFEPSRCCRVGGDPLVEFDRNQYLDRLLISRGAAHQRDDMEAQIASLRSTAALEPAVLAHGKDFVALLSFTLRRMGADNALVQPHVLRRGLMTCLDIRQLAGLPFFERLLARLV
jgi:hypothetical protein